MDIHTRVVQINAYAKCVPHFANVKKFPMQVCVYVCVFHWCGANQIQMMSVSLICNDVFKNLLIGAKNKL